MSYPPGPPPAYGQYGPPPGGGPYGPPPFDQPFYGAGLGQSWSRFWRKYATFSGRASRSEFWYMFAISVVVSFAVGIIDLVASGGDVTAMNETVTGPGDILGYLWSLATLIPSLSLTVRRLHDINRSGLWFLVIFIPLVGAILLLIWNASGPNPYGARFDRQL